MKRITVMLFLLFLACQTTSALGSGYYLPGMSTRSIARGDAFVVFGSDPLAVWQNVANLAAMKGLQFQVGMNLVNRRRV